MPFKQLLRTWSAIVIILLTQSPLAGEPTEGLTIVLPEVRPPFDKVFKEILQGIQSQVNDSAEAVAIDDDTTSDEIREILDKKRGAVTIGLGNKAKSLLEPLESTHEIVYGATFLNPGEEAGPIEGISLTPAPGPMFKWLHKLKPEIRHIHVVYQQDYNGWLIEIADIVAEQYQLEIVKHSVTNVREAATAFRTILNEADPSSNAIWLMQRDPSLDEKAVVPEILAQAWNKSFVVFSSNPSHVPRGALFALYPNNEAMGASLAKLALDTKQKRIIPLEDLHIAINVRTASHVGKNFSRREEQQFDLIFPNR